MQLSQLYNRRKVVWERGRRVTPRLHIGALELAVALLCKTIHQIWLLGIQLDVQGMCNISRQHVSNYSNVLTQFDTASRKHILQSSITFSISLLLFLRLPSTLSQCSETWLLNLLGLGIFTVRDCLYDLLRLMVFSIPEGESFLAERAN